MQVMATTRISEKISEGTKEKSNEFFHARGIKRNRAVRHALRQDLLAAQTLPQEATSPIVANPPIEDIVHSIRISSKPAPALLRPTRGESVPEDGLNEKVLLCKAGVRTVSDPRGLSGSLVDGFEPLECRNSFNRSG